MLGLSRAAHGAPPSSPAPAWGWVSEPPLHAPPGLRPRACRDLRSLPHAKSQSRGRMPPGKGNWPRKMRHFPSRPLSKERNELHSGVRNSGWGGLLTFLLTGREALGEKYAWSLPSYRSLCLEMTGTSQSPCGVGSAGTYCGAVGLLLSLRACRSMSIESLSPWRRE